MAATTLTLARGSSRDFALQINNADGTPATNVFLASDALAATMWAGDTQVATFAPAATWTNATSGQFTVSFNDADTAALAIGTYYLRVKASRGGRSGVVFDGRLELLAAPGTDAAPAAYVTLDDLRDCASWIDELQPDDGTAGFLRQRAKASNWLNEALVSRFKYSDMSPLIGQLGYGPYRLSGGNDPFPSVYIRQLLGMVGTPPAATPGPSKLMVRPLTTEIVANRAIYLICRDDLVRSAESPYGKLARRFAAEANSLLKTYRAELDINGDGYADIVINMGATNLR